VADASTGYQDTPDDQRKKAQSFFQRGKTVADTGQYDYAIEMHLQGLNLDPEAKEAHAALREIAMKRKATGGKALGMFDRMKFIRSTKDHKQSMLGAEKVLSYNPGDLAAMIALMKASHKGGYWDTTLWITAIAFRANMESPKPDHGTYIDIADTYEALDRFKEAADACQLAQRIKPDDMDLSNRIKHLAAKETMKAGGYATSTDFRGSIKNREEQQKLLDAERDVKSMGFVERRVVEAQQQYDADPNEPGKLQKLVDALVATEQMEYENRAIELLQQWYDKTKQFRFRRTIGQINVKMMNRMLRAKRDEAAANPNNEQLRKEYQQVLREQLEFELNEYGLWAENYPTEMQWPLEQARRMVKLKRYDEAIPLFQRARNDPKLKNQASLGLGAAFFEAGYYDESSDVIGTLIEEYPAKGDDTSKEMHYVRGRALEEMKDYDASLKLYSQLAQWDFGYRDVQQRIKKLRDERGKKA
jgi:tetratricopeptide (TPR) repeat protein